jgi:hypothetical protein
MKKTLLTAVLLSPFLLFAQQSLKSLDYSHSVKAEKVGHQLTEYITSQVHTPGNGSAELKDKAKGHSYVKIGETYYDLQSNGAPGNRVTLHSNGTVSAVWTTSPNDDSGWPLRGTGYNYYDGSDWGATVSDAIEAGTDRVGFPNLVTLGNGTEAVISHQAGSVNLGGYYISVNQSIGSTSWSTGNRVLDDETEPGTNYVPIWNRSGTGNNYVHTLSTYWWSDAANVPFPTKNGVNTPITYSRSTDNGATWDKVHTILPGYDSTITRFGRVGAYAIDVQDSVVAIVCGGLYTKLMMWKSTDNGETFTRFNVDNYPYGGYDDLFEPGDTVTSNDGALEVLIDDNNKVHVFYGTFTFSDADTSDGSITVFTSTSSVAHWTEGMSAPQVCGTMIDMDQNPQSFDISRETWNSLDANDIPQNNLSAAARYGSSFLATQPTASMDANGNLYMVYCTPIEGVKNFLNLNYRDILVVYSTDNGVTWSDPQNLTQDRTTENAFPVVAKDADNFLHVVFQQDEWPGTNLLSNSVDGTHPNDINYIQYTAVPVSTILNDEIGQNLLGQKEVEKQAEVFVVSQNQPNPFNGTSEVIIYLQSGSELNLTVTDILGNVVNQGNLGVLSSGNHSITIDANGLTSGMYFYTLSTKDHSITKKMQVN